MKAVQLLVNSFLPDDLRDYSREYDAKSLGDLMAQIAEKYPDRYEAISKVITDIGRNASYNQGETLTLNDMRPVVDRQRVYKEMDRELGDSRKANPENWDTSRKEIWGRYANMLEDMTKTEALAKGNNLAYSVVSGARGKPQQLAMMVTTPGLYTDYKDDIIPVFVRRSFGEGLRPHEFLAGTFGARKAVLATKRATAKGGDVSKQMVQATASTTVTQRDCGTTNGIDLPMGDKSLKGRVLQQTTAGIPAGTILDKATIGHLRKKGVENLIVRSAMTCSAHPGICAKCVGAFYDRKLPNIGDSVGITASQAIGEPITQGALNTKHTGGVAGRKREYSGFDVINQILQSPEVFPDRASVAELDGRVEAIEDAPQGGQFITINQEKHYVAPGYEVSVNVGDKVEAGDQLSDGIVDPGDIVRLRGLGEGRRYYAERLKKALDDSGMAADTRNTEILSRAAIDHVMINGDEQVAGFLPDDTVSYNYLQTQFTPPATTKSLRPHEAVGKLLQVPVLHYSIGTRITPKMVKRLEGVSIPRIFADDTPPPFVPEMVRLRGAAHSNPDWISSMHTSYLKRQLNDAAIRGQDSNVRENTHFAPRLTIGEGFGEKVKETGKF